MDTGFLGGLDAFCLDFPVYGCEPRSGESRTRVAERAVLELHRGQVAERGVPAAAVEEDLDVLEDLGPQLRLGRPRADVDELLLERREEALGDRVIEAVALAPIDWAMPAARACWPKASATNWLP
jgi:hypothetical protein